MILHDAMLLRRFHYADRLLLVFTRFRYYCFARERMLLRHAYVARA